jgi:hypothetical protein
LFETSGRICFLQPFYRFSNERTFVFVMMIDMEWVDNFKIMPWSCLRNHILGPSFLRNISFSQLCKHYNKMCPLFLTWFNWIFILIKFIGFDWMGTMDSLVHLMGTNALHPHFVIVCMLMIWISIEKLPITKFYR